MCGIFGFISKKSKSVSYLIEQLYRLEHRGYDSVGIAYKEFSENLKILKAACDVKSFADRFSDNVSFAYCNIGIVHTRWATHGVVNDINAHPHRIGCISVVHNGIIENHLELRDWLQRREIQSTLLTDTDTEVIVALINFFYLQFGSAEDAVRESIKMLKGNYSFIALFEDINMLIAVKNGNSLLLAINDDEVIFASDINVFNNEGVGSQRNQYILSDAEMVICDKLESIKVLDISKGKYVSMSKIDIEERIKRQSNNKHNQYNVVNQGYDIKGNIDIGNVMYENGHHLISEIKQQPYAIYDTLNKIDISLLELIASHISYYKRFSIIACGSSFYVAKIAREWFERFLGIRVSIELASEIRFRNHVESENGVYLFVSQSGETSDTILVAKQLKKDGNICVAIVNNQCSTLTQVVDYILYTHAGFELSVAATKTFVAQLVVLQQLFCALYKKSQNTEYLEYIDQVDYIFRDFDRLKVLFNDCFVLSESFLEKIYRNILYVNSLLYIGRSLGYGIALEGALKMKELSYIHAEGISSGELKHGTLALVDKDFPIIAINYPGNAIFDKNISNIQEVNVRNAKIFGITGASGRVLMSNVCAEVLVLPDMNELLVPFFYVLPLQLLAYKISILKGNNIDRPRNLAKSITVE